MPQVKPGRYRYGELTVEHADVIIVNQENARVAWVLSDEETTVLSEDEFTKGKFEFNLIDRGGVVTQIGNHIFHDNAVLDLREITDEELGLPTEDESLKLTGIED